MATSPAADRRPLVPAVLLGVVLALAVATVAGPPPPAGALGPPHRPADAGAPGTPDGPELAVYRVAVGGRDQAEELAAAGYDLVESRGPGHVLVVGDAAVAAGLRARGLAVSVDTALAPLAGTPARPAGGFAASLGAGPLLPAAATFAGGYHTVDAHDAHLRAVATAHPDLATVVDYGESWRKSQRRADGHDLFALCLTHHGPGDCTPTPDQAKPRAVVVAALHARELQTSELAWNLIDDLVEGYGTDPTATLLLDTTEVWVVPVANPDGRAIVEAGGTTPYLQRKNADDAAGHCAQPPTAFNQVGVDLNRNASWHWGGLGTSSDPCSQTYPGTGPASEPEQRALQELVADLFGPQRAGTDPLKPLPADTRGTLISLHSYGDLVLLPPGDRGVTADGAALRTLAFRLSHFNGYTTGTGPEILYGTTGSIDDWAYGRLGVAAFTFEVSPTRGTCAGFTPDFRCVEASLWPRNRAALLYAISVAGAPYDTPLGPTVTSLTVGLTGPSGLAGAADPADSATRSTAAGNGSLTLTAVVDGDALGRATGSVGRPRPEPVSAAEWYLDEPPGAGGTPHPLPAADGAFSSATERISATISAADWGPGPHTIYVRGRSASGHWGPVEPVTVPAVPLPTAPGAA